MLPLSILVLPQLYALKIGDLLLTGHKAQKTYFLPLCCSSAARRTVECLRR
jgi:hypothetical protein